jgi:dihydroxyacetone kinase
VGVLKVCVTKTNEVISATFDGDFEEPLFALEVDLTENQTLIGQIGDSDHGIGVRFGNLFAEE